MDYDDDRDDAVPGRSGIVAPLGSLDLRSRRSEPRPIWVKPTRGEWSSASARRRLMSNMSCMFPVRSGLGRILDPGHRTRFRSLFRKILWSVKLLTHPRCIEGVRSSAKEAAGLVLSPADPEEMMK